MEKKFGDCLAEFFFCYVQNICRDNSRTKSINSSDTPDNPKKDVMMNDNNIYYDKTASLSSNR